MESCRKTWRIPRTVELGRYHNYRVLPTILWSFPLRMQVPVEGATFHPGRPTRPEDRSEVLPDEAGALAFTRSGWLDVEVYEDEILKRFGGL